MITRFIIICAVVLVAIIAIGIMCANLEKKMQGFAKSIEDYVADIDD